MIYHSPDASEVAGSEPVASINNPDTHVRHLANVPNKDAVLSGLCLTVANTWATNTFITLVWTDQKTFAAQAADFDKNLYGRNTAGGMRSQLSQAVDDADKHIEDALPYIKNMIAGKVGAKKAVAYYPQFGFIHAKDHWDLPYDRQKRIGALKMMADAVAANGFGGSDYGTAFWADAITAYITAVQNAGEGAGDESSSVSGLVQLRTTLRRTLHSILLLLEANYPDTHEEVRRQWGFQKETY